MCIRDSNNFEIISKEVSKSMSSNVVMVQQSYNGIPIYNAVGTALIKDQKVNYFNDGFTLSLIHI